MKKKSLLSIALLGVGALTLAACSNHVQTVVGSAEAVYDSGIYSSANGYYNRWSYGNRYVKTEMTVTSGSITECVFHEAYSPATWARIAEADLPTYGDNYLTVPDYFDIGGDTMTNVYYAKYIKIGDYIFEGRVRDTNTEGDSRYMIQGEPIAWKWVDIDPNVSDSASYPYDLAAYVQLESGYTYLLRRRTLWYIEALEQGTAKRLTSYDSTTKQAGTEVDPNYPVAGKYFRDQADESFGAVLTALGGFFKGKTLAYVSSVTDDAGTRYYTLQAKDGVWNYNPQYAKNNLDESAWLPITGVSSDAFTQIQLDRYFMSANICFASVEFASLI